MSSPSPSADDWDERKVVGDGKDSEHGLSVVMAHGAALGNARGAD